MKAFCKSKREKMQLPRKITCCDKLADQMNSNNVTASNLIWRKMKHLMPIQMQFFSKKRFTFPLFFRRIYNLLPSYPQLSNEHEQRQSGSF